MSRVYGDLYGKVHGTFAGRNYRANLHIRSNDVVGKSRAFVDIKSRIKIALNNDIRRELGKFSTTIAPRIPQGSSSSWRTFDGHFGQNLTIAQREQDQTKSLTDAILRGRDTSGQMQLRVPRKKGEKMPRASPTFIANKHHRVPGIVYLSRLNVLRRANDVFVSAHKYEVLPIASRYIYAVFLSGAIICHANLTFRLDCRNTRQSAA